MPATKKAEAPFNLADRLIAAYEINDRINQYLLENLSPDVWRATPPGGKGRTIASIVAHVHNVRLMWLKSAGARDMPAKLEGDSFSIKEASAALEASAKAMAATLRQALATDGRIKGFKPDAAAFLGYLVAHDAHHRGQISMLARLLGHALPQSVNFGMWEWGVG